MGIQSPKCRLCRREGVKLFLKGERCYTKKCAIEREGRRKPPGQHGEMAASKKLTEYGKQLREKQKTKRIYRVEERPFRRYVEEAIRRPGVAGENLLQLLEMRLDNVVYRLGLAVSRDQARQLVSHGFFAVNGRKVNIPSYQLRPGDEVAVAEGKRGSEPIASNLQRRGAHLPDWLSFDATTLTGRVLARPTREQIDTDVEEQMIIEFYSR
ncbi:MAG: 30S ribosomal protein S4 [Armatimonadota bacterium]|nr:30S ribosomal protein S4 [bacterium]MCS7308895.1 30S ribosomal protein S4 [Armatimonadota bacterium]MDW8103533.1 30S ribosomal protein S4 [Armatimonadota bacterium]MDW8289485.1 30S ribosomal protein S4 [Armatimonadota bacterium]